ncbi:major facilitator superfamily domain-containing protein [Linnemannia elongata]|nr:major facilitator superfamily domain-containing protein [Linnemannia elongata]
MSVPSTRHGSATTTPTTLRCIRIPMRYWILILSGVGLMISYADRSNMAVAIVAIGTEFGYNKSQQGIILASFYFGYIVTPILGGTLSDRYGGKTVLATGALVWTVFTVCTPLAAAMGLTWAVIARIGLGLGEGVAYPAIHSMIGTWIPPCEKSKAVASVTAMSYLGSVIALPTSSALVVSSWGWRGIFWLFGTLGLLWSIAWQIFGASDPSSSTLISDKEARWISQQKRLDQIQGQDQEARHRLPETVNQAIHVSGGQVEDENEQIRSISSNGESILYRPLSSIPLGQTTSRHSEGSDESVLRTRSEESPREGVERHVDTSARILSESPLSDSASESSKSMNMWLAFRNRKRADRSVQTNSPKAPVPWKQLLKRREVWAIIISQLCNSLGFFVMQSWLPTFYLDFYNVDVGKIGYFTVLPSAIQGAMGLFAGYLGDKAIQDWGWSSLMVRRVGQSVGSFGLGVFLLLAVKLAHTAMTAMILITIGMALNGFTMIGASVYQHDFCPEHAGFIFSLGNTAGSLPAIVGVYFVGFLLDGHGANRWDVIWTTVCALYFVGATAFILLSTHRRL